MPLGLDFRVGKDGFRNGIQGRQGVCGHRGGKGSRLTGPCPVQSGFDHTFRRLYFLLYDSTREHNIHKWVVLLARALSFEQSRARARRLVLFGGQGIPRRGGGAIVGMELAEESIDCGIRFAVCI